VITGSVLCQFCSPSKSNEIRFYDTNGLFGEFTNFYRNPITYNGISFPTSEHAYQWSKFSGRQDIQKQILAASTPSEARQIGINNNKYVDNWFHQYKYQIMVNILTAKFGGDLVLKKLLKGTGTAKLVEDSPKDDYWGVGPNGNGQNKLGEALMEVRKSL
jgi:hypothetical protein